jgi:hypothetical protein
MIAMPNKDGTGPNGKGPLGRGRRGGRGQKACRSDTNRKIPQPSSSGKSLDSRSWLDIIGTASRSPLIRIPAMLIGATVTLLTMAKREKQNSLPSSDREKPVEIEIIAENPTEDPSKNTSS